MSTEPDDWPDMDLAPLCAFVFSKRGEADLRWCLNECFTKPESRSTSSRGNREMLEDAAEELQERGFHQVAAILLDIAQHCQSGIDNVPSWATDYYKVEDRPRMVEQWRNKWIKDRKMERERRQEERRRLSLQNRPSMLAQQR